jgi:hypothetical protein
MSGNPTNQELAAIEPSQIQIQKLLPESPVIVERLARPQPAQLTDVAGRARNSDNVDILQSGRLQESLASPAK